MNYQSYLGDFEESLAKTIASLQIPNKMREAIEYAVFGGGKRLRPLLVFMTAKAFNVAREAAMPLAVALELIHSYSLVHDDLPCMDNDDYRRGKLTLHKVYGEGVAVLIGDILLNTAHEILLNGVERDARLARSASLISGCAGALGMAGGQFFDITQKNFNEQELLHTYALKTGRLFLSAVISVMAYATADDNVLSAGTVYAENMGILFQLSDDIIDLDNGNDLDKNTYPNLFGMERASVVAEELYLKAKDATCKLKNSAEFIDLLNLVKNRRK